MSIAFDIQIVFLLSDPFSKNRKGHSFDGVCSGCRPRAVGKRTPRFPVPVREDTHVGSSPRKLIKSDRDADEDGVHVAALALAEASQKAGSPQVSRTPLRIELGKSSPIQSRDRKVLHGCHI